MSNLPSEQPLLSSYNQTKLYRLLKKRSETGTRAKAILSLLDGILDDAEEVLRVASTAPLDFTLHDNLHSFRVADKMMIVLPPQMPEQLADEEIALLLLAAYLHDIGMTPDRETTVKYKDLIIGEKNTILAPSEKQDFYDWFDESSFADTIKLPIDTSHSVGLNQLEQLLTYFVRAKHNDWSARWIEKNVDPLCLDRYPDFRDHLIKLCISHHLGFEELKREEYNPKQIGITEKPTIVNLRYLACVLRVADILEFDPERTPDIIYQHRQISPGSRIFWHQSIHINSAPSADRKKFVFQASPPDARIHQALRIVASDINAEFRLSHRLNDLIPFKHSVIGELPHFWDLRRELTVNIDPKNNDYEFIEGAFRPNTSKLLQILSGTHLYRSEMDAVRELLQNAFDAVKESLAYELVNDSRGTMGSELVSDSITVDVRLEQSEGRLFLVCADQGVGMTKNIIENYVLVSGNDRSKQLRSLERRLEARGVKLGRTGNFGVGVLSYFMLADQVTITTRRSQLCSDSEPTGWVFETEGVGSFGELKRQQHRLRGTEVRLRIKPPLAADPAQFEERVLRYLMDILVRIPCNLRFVGSRQEVNWKKGWIRTSEDFARQILHLVPAAQEKAIESEFLSAESREKRLRTISEWRAIANNLEATLRWQVTEGALPQELGFYRAHLPYFELPGGPSLAFLSVKNEDGQLSIKPVGDGHYITPEPRAIESWKGMIYASHNVEIGKRFFLEIDWTSSTAGEISVDRWNVRRNQGSNNAADALQQKLKTCLTDFLNTNSRSVFELLNARLAGVPSRTETPHWLGSGPHSNLWVPVQFPNRISEDNEQETLGEVPLFGIPLLRSHTQERSWEGIGWPSLHADPDRVAVISSIIGLQLTPIFEGPPTVSLQPFVTSIFPPQWTAVMGAFFYNLYGWQNPSTVWNRNNPLVQRFSNQSWQAVSNLFSPLRNGNRAEFKPLAYRDKIINDEGFLANFIGQMLAEKAADAWKALLETDPQVRDAISLLIQRSGIHEHYFESRGRWTEISQTQIEAVGSDDWGLEITKHLPKPSDDWLIHKQQSTSNPTRLKLPIDHWQDKPKAR